MFNTLATHSIVQLMSSPISSSSWRRHCHRCVNGVALSSSPVRRCLCVITITSSSSCIIVVAAIVGRLTKFALSSSLRCWRWVVITAAALTHLSHHHCVVLLVITAIVVVYKYTRLTQQWLYCFLTNFDIFVHFSSKTNSLDPYLWMMLTSMSNYCFILACLRSVKTSSRTHFDCWLTW